MKSADIVIIGGGMVGLALAASLAELNCQIIVIEKNPPQPTACLDAPFSSHRVSAINFCSRQFLEQCGAWQHISVERRSAYQRMVIWEKDSFASLEFDQHSPEIKTLGLNELGMIIENATIQSALWQQVTSQTNVELIQTLPQTLGLSDNGAFLTLSNGEMLSAKLVVGADGACSWLRSQAQIPLVNYDYQHTALVCHVKTQESHQHTAWQVFSLDSILAFLPLTPDNLCSIVWSLPPEKAKYLVGCSQEEFQKALNIASDGRLGLCELQTSRQIYPLVARYARDFSQSRVALIGDAAHTIHPLAGLGVNLGFSDVVCLAEQISFHWQRGDDIGERHHLRSFERSRKVEAIKLLAAMEGLKQLFSGNHPLKKVFRGVGLSLTNQSGLIKKILIKQAIGV